MLIFENQQPSQLEVTIDDQIKQIRSDAPISNNQMQTNNQMHPFQFMQKYLINNHTQILKKKLSKNK